MHLASHRLTGRMLLPGLLPSLLLGLLLLLSACGGGSSGTGGPAGAVPATLSFSATSGPGATPLATPQAALGNGVDVGVFRFGASQIQLEQQADSEAQSEAQFRGQFIVDLIAGTIVDVSGSGAATALPSFLPAGSYHELKFVLTPLAGVDANRPDVPIALQVEGSYASGSVTRPYTLTVSVSFELKVEGPNAIDLSGGSHDLIVSLRLDTLLSPANLDALSAALGVQADPTSGVFAIAISDQTDPQALALLQEMLHGALEFGDDRNGDHQLDANEDVQGDPGTSDAPPAVPPATQPPAGQVDDHGQHATPDTSVI